MVGSVEVGKLADLVLWKPAFFGAKTEIIVKGGTIVQAQMGDANASIPTPGPLYSRPMFGAKGNAVGQTSFVMVANSAVETVEKYDISKKIVAIKNCRNIGKKDMKHNDCIPNIAVDPETYKVTIDGHHLTCEPATKVPLAQLYNLF